MERSRGQGEGVSLERIDIIIPTYGKEDFTVACLGSIVENTDPDSYRILWIDNGSSEDSRDYVRDYLEACTIPYRAILNEVNLGFIKATNQGIATSQGDVVLLNNDTEVPDGWLEVLAKGHRDAGYSIVGPLAQEGIESWQSLGNARNILPIKLPAPGYFPVVRGMVAFFCAFFSRKMIEDIGYLSECFGMGFGDDDEYCARALHHGYKIGLATNLIVTHHHRTTFKDAFPQYTDMQRKNMALFEARRHRL